MRPEETERGTDASKRSEARNRLANIMQEHGSPFCSRCVRQKLLKSLQNSNAVSLVNRLHAFPQRQFVRVENSSNHDKVGLGTAPIDDAQPRSAREMQYVAHVRFARGCAST